MGDKCSTTRVLILLTSVFLVATIALAAYVIYDKTKSEDDKDTIPETDVIMRYPGYFRTKVEQAVFAQQLDPVIAKENATAVQPSNDTTLDKCVFNCPRQNLELGEFTLSGQDEAGRPGRRRRASDMLHHRMVSVASALHQLTKRDAITQWASTPVYHGCCISYHHFVSPDTLPDRYGNDLTIVQFNDRRQYFLTQRCRHDRDCSGCTCRQEQQLVTAVVENEEYPDNSDTEFVLDLVKLPGCCKCFND